MTVRQTLKLLSGMPVCFRSFEKGQTGNPWRSHFAANLLLQRFLAQATAMQDCGAWNSSVDRPFSYFPIYRKLICKGFTEFAGKQALGPLQSFKFKETEMMKMLLFRGLICLTVALTNLYITQSLER